MTMDQSFRILLADSAAFGIVAADHYLLAGSGSAALGSLFR
ncbi:MAG: hypothetical protein AAF899_03435 [Pseudomonadota bacterium]